ncbi:MAG: hypothetical protein ABFD45_03610 [Smithella sp.]
MNNKKVSSAEIIKNAALILREIERKARISIAEIESRTKKMEEEFKSVDASIQKTGELLRNLYRDFTTGAVQHFRFIEKQLKLENERFDKTFKSKTKN